MYPYWLVCRYDDCDDVGRILEKSSIERGDLEHPEYGPGVEDQSQIYISAEELRKEQEARKKAETERQRKEAEERRQEEKKQAEEDRQRREVEERRRQEEKRAEVQAQRKSERHCIMCGKPLNFLSQLMGRDRHKKCAEFLE
jgi:hypothetical protein